MRRQVEWVITNNNKSRLEPVGGHMTKKGRTYHTLVGTCLAAALPALALASPPSDAAVGQIDAILSFCAKSDPSLGKNAQQLRSLLTQDASPGARNSKGYQEGYQQVIDALETGNHGQEIAACVAGLKGHGEHEDHYAYRADGRR